MIIREVAMSRPGAVCRAAEGRRTDGEGVAYERIAIDPDRMSGLSCIRGTRVTVSAVLGQLAVGLTFPELLADFPYVDRDDVLAALEFAAAAVANLQQQDLTSFVLGVAMERARAGLAEDRILRLTPHEVVQLEKALDSEPEVVPQLKAFLDRLSATREAV